VCAKSVLAANPVMYKPGVTKVNGLPKLSEIKGLGQLRQRHLNKRLNRSLVPDVEPSSDEEEPVVAVCSRYFNLVLL
jgi:hypothetical protein